MAKAAKKKEPKKETPKKEKPLKVDMSFEHLLKLAANSPRKRNNKD